VALYHLNYWVIGNTPLTFSFFGKGDWKERTTFSLDWQLTDLRDELIFEDSIKDVHYYFSHLNNNNACFVLEDQVDQRIRSGLLLHLSNLDDIGYNILQVANTVEGIVTNCRTLCFSQELERGGRSFHLAYYVINMK